MTDTARRVMASSMTYTEWGAFFEEIPINERGVYFCMTADPHTYSSDDHNLHKGDVGGKMHIFITGDNRKFYIAVGLTLDQTCDQILRDEDLQGVYFVGYRGEVLDRIETAFETNQLENVFDVVRPLCEWNP